MPDTPVAGWWSPESRAKFHYVTGKPWTTSLCGKWMYLGGLVEPGRDDHVQNCLGCSRKRLAAVAKEALDAVPRRA